MQSRFTQKAILAQKAAEKAAKELGHGYIGTEHILLGLIRTKDSLAGNVLEAHEITEEKVLELMEQLIAPTSRVSFADPEG